MLEAGAGKQCARLDKEQAQDSLDSGLNSSELLGKSSENPPKLLENSLKTPPKLLALFWQLLNYSPEF